MEKLKNMTLLKQDRKKLEKIFSDGAEKIEEYFEHWISGYVGDGGGLSYCLECAEKEVEKLLKEYPDEKFEVDGGWGGKSDIQEVCEGCNKVFDNSYTQTACENEVAHFLEHGFDPTDNAACLSMNKVIDSAGWGPPTGENIKFYDDLHRLCQQILNNI